MNETDLKTRLGNILQGVLGTALKRAGFSAVPDHQYEPTCEKPDFLIPDEENPRIMIEVHQTEARNSFQMKTLRTFTAVAEAKAHYGNDLVSVNVLFGDPGKELPESNVLAMCGFFDVNVLPRKDSKFGSDIASLEQLAVKYAGLEKMKTDAAAEKTANEAEVGMKALEKLIVKSISAAKPNRALFPIWDMERKRVTSIGNPPSAGSKTYYKRMLLRSLFLADDHFEELLRTRDPDHCSPEVKKQLIATGVATLREEIDGDYYTLIPEFEGFLSDPDVKKTRQLCKKILDSVPDVHWFFEDIRDPNRRSRMSEVFLKEHKKGRQSFESFFKRCFEKGACVGIEHTRCWVADLMPLSLEMSHNAFNGLMFRHTQYSAKLGNPFNNIAIRSARLGTRPDVLDMYKRVALDVFYSSGTPSISAHDLSERLLKFRLGAAIKLRKLDPLFLLSLNVAEEIGCAITRVTVNSIVSDLAASGAAGHFKLFAIKGTKGSPIVLFNAVAVHEGNGDHKSKEWGARRLATLYRMEKGEIRRSEYQDAIFVIDGEWTDKDVARLYRSGWNRVVRLGDLEKTLIEVFGIKKISKKVKRLPIQIPEEELPLAAEEDSDL